MGNILDAILALGLLAIAIFKNGLFAILSLLWYWQVVSSISPWELFLLTTHIQSSLAVPKMANLYLIALLHVVSWYGFLGRYLKALLSFSHAKSSTYSTEMNTNDPQNHQLAQLPNISSHWKSSLKNIPKKTQLSFSFCKPLKVVAFRLL